MTRTLLILALVLPLAACETAKGAGRDLEKVGDTIQDAASTVQKKF